jgi:hypothetical protein
MAGGAPAPGWLRVVITAATIDVVAGWAALVLFMATFVLCAIVTGRPGGASRADTRALLGTAVLFLVVLAVLDRRDVSVVVFALFRWVAHLAGVGATALVGLVAAVAVTGLVLAVLAVADRGRP